MDAKLSPPSYYPRLVEGGVYHCGFSSPKSYGAASYLIRRQAGNWLTDSPRWSDELARTFADWGGLEGIFLTHRDDVADAEHYARRFGARVVIHEGHAVLLYQEKYLFAGDHLDGDPEHETLDADPVYCWWDWEAQIRSVERLKAYRFEWVLPGHGRRLKLAPERMNDELENLVERMRMMSGRSA
jgi:glyoxylase-like metal-dependent hydrolase (beta-lactamase superfamily II)